MLIPVIKIKHTRCRNICEHLIEETIQAKWDKRSSPSFKMAACWIESQSSDRMESGVVNTEPEPLWGYDYHSQPHPDTCKHTTTETCTDATSGYPTPLNAIKSTAIRHGAQVGTSGVEAAAAAEHSRPVKAHYSHRLNQTSSLVYTCSFINTAISLQVRCW